MRNAFKERRTTLGANSDQKDSVGPLPHMSEAYSTLQLKQKLGESQYLQPGGIPTNAMNSLDPLDQQYQLVQQQHLRHRNIRGRSMVERVDKNESTGRDTIYMNSSINPKVNVAQINQHQAVSEMQKTNPALFEISHGRVTPSRQNNRSELVNNDETIVVTRIDNGGVSV